MVRYLGKTVENRCGHGLGAEHGLDRPSTGGHQNTEAHAEHQRAEEHRDKVQLARQEHKNVGQVLHQPHAPEKAGGEPLQAVPDLAGVFAVLGTTEHPALQRPQPQAIGRQTHAEGEAIPRQRAAEQRVDIGWHER